MREAASALERDQARALPIIVGPTASGKSALALGLAARLAGVIVNADAMQCYADWRIITARPSVADEAAAVHRLYGVRALDQAVDAAWWRKAALAVMADAKNPILCGGTGMYLRALIEGLAPVPDFAPEARAEARAMLAAHGAKWLHGFLAMHDPVTAARLRPSDPQRVARAVEVLLGTGHGLAHWHAQPTEPLRGFAPVVILLDPPRTALRAAIERRFHAMLAAGAVEEVRAVVARGLANGLPDDLPGWRAHGVPELRAYLAGTLDLAAATAAAIDATARYTKRQATWFRHQRLADARRTQVINARIDDSTQFLERTLDEIMSLIKYSG
ncbi:MAG TPA: tRNA (adenosine(37)-N6)-dimethylallyltransferase MiaA [Acidiphilium sp.]|nr:MAG: tRNA (adenosine(37)-N6)-dimethylallyltransferase MiaA [Acidiphilium sp. 21-60-14]OYV90663.1 MAG: tRNA (adenosine(37)-N6)-dimethylallyltransferase MiaA [Acidiphilium sp. 37-60-79]HQT88162.1 tRNA (adenosine(37)-N6)-dimethylallyltransferase MiaA [Acidiphilium sp.]HQU24218.1 tRNA (adenosine(37)-N6)-dimethylallyltransferase MiaA [Acidiphilium sp.]